MKKTIKSLPFYPNGNVIAFDAAGEQLEDIQAIGWMELYLDRLQAMGYDAEHIETIRARGNDGAWKDGSAGLAEDGNWVIDFKPFKSK